jgi:hypothetical protein
MRVKKKSAAWALAAQNQIEAAAAAVTSMRAPDRGNLGCVARCRQPVVNGRTNLAALNRRLAGPMVSGNQQHEPVARGNRPFEAAIDRLPCSVEVHTVKVEDPIGLYASAGKPPVPTSIQGGSGR